MNRNLSFFVLLFCFSAFSNLSAQNFNLIYTFSSVTNSSGRTDPSVLPQATGVVADSFRAVGALSANSGAGGRFSFSQWPLGATSGSSTFAGSIDVSRYYEVKVTPTTGYELDIASIIFTLQRSTTGVRQWAVRSSRDGFANNLPASLDPANAAISIVDSNKFQIVDRATTSAQAGNKVILSNGTKISNTITFRFYGFNAESTGGTFSLNRVEIVGVANKIANASIISVSTSNLSFPPTAANIVSDARTYTVKGENLQSPITITTTHPFYVSLDTSNYVTSIVVKESDAINDKTIYVKFAPTSIGTFNGTISHTSTGAATKIINVSGDGVDPANLIFNFDSCTVTGSPGSGFVPYSVSGQQSWACSNFGRNNTKGVEMNGFSGGSAMENDDWLISPRLVITNLNVPILKFYSRGEFSGPSLQLLISTDYDGSSNPNTASWKELDGYFPSTTNTWTLSDGIDLTAYKKFLNVYIAFRYTSSAELGAARWTLDDVDVTDRSKLLIANPASLTFGEASVGKTTMALPFIVKALGFGDVRLTAPDGFQLSRDSLNFVTSLVIKADSIVNDTKVFARFAPSFKALKIEGTIRFTGVGLDSNKVVLTGTSYPKSETFDAGSYNLSFFGSNPTNNPTPSKIATQIANIASVVKQLNLDVLGVEEVSNDSAFFVMVKQVPNMNGILSNRWSYSFDPADPNFPPQKVGFIYDTTTTKLLESRAMFGKLYDSARGAYPQKLPNYPGGAPSSFWASGRLPYLATFETNLNGSKQRIHVVVIHAKSASDAASYNRRVYDAKVLKDSLDFYYKGENIIIVGDYNDRIIGSTYTGSSNSPYKPFIDDSNNYLGLTQQLDQEGKSSFISGTSLIDHIIISNKLFSSYIANSTEINDPRSYITSYNATTASDHLPVFSRFNLASVLPITLMQFTAQPKGAEVMVNWKTTNEFNNNYFVVERSIDGRSFIALGTKKAAGFIVSSADYNFIDGKPNTGINYYRLKQVDVDGKFSYSNIVMVAFGDKKQLKVYPNPITTNVQITLQTSSSNLTARLMTTSGTIAMHINGDMKKVNQIINQKLPSLARGLYILQIVDGGEIYKSSFIKQ